MKNIKNVLHDDRKWEENNMERERRERERSAGDEIIVYKLLNR